MDFLNDLDETQKMMAEVILEEENTIAEKLSMLEENGFDSKIVDKVEKFLVGNDNAQAKNVKEDVTPTKTADFLLFMDEKVTREAAELLLKANKYALLSQLIEDQSLKCRNAFAEFMKQNNLPLPKSKQSTKVSNSKNDDEKKIANTLESTDEEASDKESSNKEPQWSPDIKPDFFRSFPKCLNILVLGQTGVGKSTFINGMVNYLKYNNVHEANKNQVEILIRSSFTHMNVDYNTMRIDCEPTIEIEENENENENTEVGESSTQSPKAYLFEWGPAENKKSIRIIDTPGVGDVRGLEQEQLNFAKILSFIADYSEIHAILILLKPNESKLTLTYRYCINELLAHLHVSASKNILFCFTNSRTTLYTPGDTMPALQSHLNKLKEDRGVVIPLNHDTVYCFDNEAFRFLCAWKSGAEFTEKEKNDFDKSWRVTVAETFRLFKKISQLPVHETEKTLSVNNIRQIILTMARPLAEIAKNQMTNSQLIDDKLKEIDALIKQGKSLSSAQLFINQVVLTAKEIDYPSTVCTAESCIDIVKLEGTTSETYYKQKCHSPCGLTGIQTGIVPNPQIKECACFDCNGDVNNCRACGHNWKTHLHIRYELVKSSQKVVDPTVNESIKNCEDKLKSANLFMEVEQKRKDALEKEFKTIRAHCAEFAAFLTKHSMIPYNDVYEEYIEHLIREENGKVSEGGGKAMLIKLQNFKSVYIQQVKTLKSYETGAVSTKSVEEIYQMLNEIKNMENCGPLLKEIEKLVILSVRGEFANKVTNVNIKQGWINALHKGGKSASGSRKGTKKN